MSLTRWVVMVGSVLAVLLWAAPARADTASVSFLDASGRNDPVVDVGRAFVLSGNSATQKRVYIRYRPVGGAPCAPSASSDSGSNSFDSFGGDTFNDSQVNGDFTLRKTGAWQTPGTYMFCIWLASSEGAVATPIRQDITFRAPTGAVSGSVAPATALTGQAATVTITGASEAPKQVFATYRLAGGAPCAISYTADSGIGFLDGTSVNGAFALTKTLAVSTPGTYVMCMWLADSESDSAPVAGPQQATFTVVAPCVVPELGAGAPLTTVQAQLGAAHCSLGAIARRASRSVKRGRLIRLGAKSGTTLGPGAPVAAVLSTGRPCVVPSGARGLTLDQARRRLRAGGCTPGSVSRVHSHLRRGRVVAFSSRAGRTLASRAVVGIRLSRGR